jgi:Common central domain of tyrosinase/von Willebrand factor type A domain
VNCRKNVKSLTTDEKTRFVNAIVALKSQNSVIHPGSQSRYDDFVETHMNAMMVTPGWAHQDSVFFPWHREFLYQFEKLLQTVDPTVTIPYWDWTREQNSAAAGFPFKNDLIGLGGDPTDNDRVNRDPAAPPVDATHPYVYPFDPKIWSDSIKVIDEGDTLNFFQREFGQRIDAPNLPLNDVIVTGVGFTYRQAIGSADYLTLRLRSEDIHNLVHRWVGGNMLRMTSPNDPVFFMHHAAIDRMWSIWQKKVPPGTQFYVASSTAAGHKLNDPMIFNDVNPAPFVTTASPADVINGHTMHGDGVWYDSDIPELTNETGSTLTFVDIPEGLTSYKAVKFKIKGCRPVHFRIIGAPSGNFGLTTMGTEFIANPDASADFFYGYVWIQLVAVAGTIPNSSVDIHAYIIDEEGYYAATEGGEYPLGDFHVDLNATTVPRENNAIALVLDRSGSMADPAGGTSTKSDLLKTAIQVFRDLMLSNDELAVVTFDNLVDTPIPIQQVSAAPAFSTIDLTPRNTTWIGGGIQQGAVQLAAGTLTNRSMIILTDGNENVHPYIGEIDPSLLTNRTYAIGFGLPGTVSDAALHQITSNTHGDLIITGNISTEEQRFNLTKYFVQLLAGVTKMDVILDPQGSLFMGSKQVIPFQLTDADVYADIIVLCPLPKLLDFFLETPDGKIIKPSTAAPNVKYILGQQVVFYRIVLPALTADPAGSHAGEWKAILSIKSADEIKKLSRNRTLMEAVRTNSVRGSLPYSFIAHTYSNLNLNAYKHQESLKPGAAVTLFASLEEYDVPLPTDAVVWAEITNPDQSTFDLKVLQKINGATYSASFNTTLPGVYFCRVRAEGLTRKGVAFTRERTMTAGVYYGDYNPLPQPKPGEDICHLIHCFLSEETLSPSVIKKLEELGINLKHLKECIAKVCPEVIVERIPDLKYKAFAAAREKQMQTTPAINFRKAEASKPVKKIAAKPARKPQPKKNMVSHFPPLTKKAKISRRQETAARDQEVVSHFPPLTEESNSRK